MRTASSSTQVHGDERRRAAQVENPRAEHRVGEEPHAVHLDEDR